jgi:hypothetical protein
MALLWYVLRPLGMFTPFGYTVPRKSGNPASVSFVEMFFTSEKVIFRPSPKSAAIDVQPEIVKSQSECHRDLKQLHQLKANSKAAISSLRDILHFLKNQIVRSSLYNNMSIDFIKSMEIYL